MLDYILSLFVIILTQAGQDERPEGDLIVAAGADGAGESAHCWEESQEESQVQGKPWAGLW